MYRPCEFDRDYYLENYEKFETMQFDDPESELTEFNEETDSLAYELAYTRYFLAKAEVKIKRLKRLLNSQP